MRRQTCPGMERYTAQDLRDFQRSFLRALAALWESHRISAPSDSAFLILLLCLPPFDGRPAAIPPAPEPVHAGCVHLINSCVHAEGARENPNKQGKHPFHHRVSCDVLSSSLLLLLIFSEGEEEDSKCIYYLVPGTSLVSRIE